MRRPLSLRAHLSIGAGFLMVGWFGGSIVLWHVVLGNREPPTSFMAIFRHLHLFMLVCLACTAIGVAQVRRGWLSIAQVRGHLADVHARPEARLGDRYPSEIAPLAADVNRLLDQRDRMVADASLAAGDLAHGLKTPLAVLTQDAERARREGHIELAASVAAQVDRMRRQVDVHLARARIDASRHRPLSSVALLHAAEGIVRTLERLYRERGLTFDLRIPDGLAVVTTREDIEEILGNVLDNSCKWGRSLCRVSARAEADVIVIDVDDDGAGIGVEVRERFPARGVRADESAPGSGLGLSIVRGLTEAYGGQLSLHESPLGGLRVTIRLPAGLSARVSSSTGQSEA